MIGSGLNDPAPAVREDFRYDPNGRRYAKETTWQEAGGTRTEEVHYVGNVEIAYYAITDEVNKITKTRISPNVMHVKASGSRLVDGHPRSWSETHFEYAHRDHLGSIEVVTDESGATLHDLAFDPFGLRKQSDWSGSLPSAELDALMVKDWGQAPRVRGFTGHEHLDRTGFIHMNGRVYDPVLGRFVSPDPFVQFPGFSQSWNRYSYVNNTPTSFTDPTGYFEDLHGTGGTTNEDGYGGTVGAWGRARANATWAGMMPPPGLVNCPDEHSGLCLNPFPDSLSTNGVAGMSSNEPSTDDPGSRETDVDGPPRSTDFLPGGPEGAAFLRRNLDVAPLTNEFTVEEVRDIEFAQGMVGLGAAGAAVCAAGGCSAVAAGATRLGATAATGAARIGAGVAALKQAAVRSLFGKGALLNRGESLRIGIGRESGRSVFRVAGRWLGKLPPSIRSKMGIKEIKEGVYKWDLWDRGPL